MDSFVAGSNKNIKKRQARIEAFGMGCSCDAKKKGRCRIDEMSVECSVGRKAETFGRVLTLVLRESPPEGRR